MCFRLPQNFLSRLTLFFLFYGFVFEVSFISEILLWCLVELSMFSSRLVYLFGAHWSDVGGEGTCVRESLHVEEDGSVPQMRGGKTWVQLKSRVG